MKKYTSYIIIAFLSILLGIIIGKFLLVSDQEGTHTHESPSVTQQEEFTCSMHPQIRQNEPGICPICEMDLIPVGSNDSSDDPTILQMTPESAKLAQVATSKIISNSGSAESTQIRVEGTVALDESLANVQAAHIGGRIDQLYVSFNGEYVRKGQLIATLYAAELLSATKELLTAVANEERLPGLKNAAIQKVKNWKISDAQIQEVIESGKPIQDINLYADFSGYITQRMVSEGDHVKEGELLYKLASTNRLWIEFNIFENDIPNIRNGQQVEFTGPALGAQAIKAAITYINPVLDANTRSVVARAQVNNKNNLLKPGMLVQGKINIGKSSSEQVLVPKTAVLWTGQRSVVYIAKQNEEGIPYYQYRQVTLGDQVGAYYVVLSGLEIGEEVVSKGVFAIDAAAQLNNGFSMMNSNVSLKKDQLGNRTPNFSDQVSENFKLKLEEYVAAYLNIKNALVETDPITTSKSTAEVLNTLDAIPHVSLEVEAHEFWMDKSIPLKAHLKNITEETEVEKQRKQFEFISELTIDLIEAFGVNEQPYYIQYCPMAFNNKGASWLSDETGIRNPYFGDKMLKCGQVTDTIGLIN